MNLDRLRSQVQAYARWYPAEADTVVAFESLIDGAMAGGADIASRSHFAPGHLTASAFVLHPTSDAVVLIRHAKLGRWLQPGGHLDPGDAGVAAAAVRELGEETGITEVDLVGLIDLDAHDIPARRDEPAHVHFDVRFGFRARRDALADLAEAPTWVPPGRLADMADVGILRAVDKLRARIR